MRSAARPTTRLSSCRLWLAACCAMPAACAAPAVADVVTLNNGSRIIGTVERLAAGKLVLQTEFAGKLEIDAAQIATIEVDHEVIVDMSTGDRLIGKIQWESAIDRPVVQTEMGGVPITVDGVKGIRPEGEPDPEIAAMQDQLAKQRQELEPKWAFSFEAGMIYKEGNTETVDARGKAEAIRKTPKDTLRFYLTGEYGENDEVRNTAQIIAGASYEYLFTERVFGYARNEYEYDEFENLDLRVTFAIGAGYYFIKEPHHELKARAGVGYQHETFRNGMTTDSGIMDIGADYRLEITPWLRFTHSFTYVPTFESVRDYRLVFDTAFVIPIGESDKWKLKLGATHEYDSLPQPGRERLDQTYYANILLELK